MKLRRSVTLVLLLAVLGAGCSSPPDEPLTLRLSTTTSTYDSGLLDAILPVFEQAHNAEVDVIAVGTGQAIEIGKSGDADVVLVHNRMLEEAFVADGYGVERLPVMFNDFILVGPPADPAGISGATSAVDALQRIHASSAPFVSRGDDSGTYARELTLWEAAGLTPTLTDAWYRSIGQGMGETLQFANEVQGYTLSDRGTYLSLQGRLEDLTILFGGGTIADNPDAGMLNPYGLIRVMPQDPASFEALLAREFVGWMTSIETQELIRDYGVERFGQPLFYPASMEWCGSSGAGSPGCSP